VFNGKLYILFQRKSSDAVGSGLWWKMGNRDRHDIVMEILKKAANGKTKTELMRDVGLSYLQTKQYFNVLVEGKMVEINENGLYKTTKKGLDFLEKCQECFLCDWHKQKR
jgi:predicted transcriptional regulator